MSLPQWKARHMSFCTHAGIFLGWISRSGTTRSKSKCIWNFNYYPISFHRDCVILHTHHHYRIACFPRASKNISLKSFFFWLSAFMWSWNRNPQKLYNFLLYSHYINEENRIILIMNMYLRGNFIVNFWSPCQTTKLCWIATRI